jgi:hypothetical protein
MAELQGWPTSQISLYIYIYIYYYNDKKSSHIPGEERVLLLVSRKRGLQSLGTHRSQTSVSSVKGSLTDICDGKVPKEGVNNGTLLGVEPATSGRGVTMTSRLVLGGCPHLLLLISSAILFDATDRPQNLLLTEGQFIT